MSSRSLLHVTLSGNVPENPHVVWRGQYFQSCVSICTQGIRVPIPWCIGTGSLPASVCTPIHRKDQPVWRPFDPGHPQEGKVKKAQPGRRSQSQSTPVPPREGKLSLTWGEQSNKPECKAYFRALEAIAFFKCPVEVLLIILINANAIFLLWKGEIRGLQVNRFL